MTGPRANGMGMRAPQQARAARIPHHGCCCGSREAGGGRQETVEAVAGCVYMVCAALAGLLLALRMDSAPALLVAVALRVGERRLMTHHPQQRGEGVVVGGGKARGAECGHCLATDAGARIQADHLAGSGLEGADAAPPPRPRCLYSGGCCVTQCARPEGRQKRSRHPAALLVPAVGRMCWRREEKEGA